jgi:hypothetical protein
MVERDVLQDLINKKLSTSEIGKRLGCSPTNVLYWIHKLGIHPSFNPHGKGRRTKSPEETAARIAGHVTIHRRRLKARAIAYKGGKCALCGYDRCNAAMEFHHLDKTIKSFGLSKKGVTRAWSSIQTELDKCILICANCHREVEAGVTVIPQVNGRFLSQEERQRSTMLSYDAKLRARFDGLRI